MYNNIINSIHRNILDAQSLNKYFTKVLDYLHQNKDVLTSSMLAPIVINVDNYVNNRHIITCSHFKTRTNGYVSYRYDFNKPSYTFFRSHDTPFGTKHGIFLNKRNLNRIPVPYKDSTLKPCTFKDMYSFYSQLRTGLQHFIKYQKKQLSKYTTISIDCENATHTMTQRKSRWKNIVG